MPLNFHYTFLLIAAGALLIPGRRRRLALLGLVPLGLAIATTTVRLGGELSGLALRAAERSAPLGFLRINTGIFLLGLIVVFATGLVAIVRAGREETSADIASHGPAPGALPGWIAMFLIGAGAAPMIAAHRQVLAYIGWLPPLGYALAIGAGAVALFLLGRLSRLGRVMTWLDEHLLEPNPTGLRPQGNTTFDLVWIAGFFATAIIMAITPSLRAFALASVVTGTVGHVLLRRMGGGRALPFTALFSLFIIPVFQSFTTIMGDPAPRIAELASGPISLAAEPQIVFWLALTAWGMAGLWPLQGMVFPLLAPVSGILLIRLGAHSLPAGLDHWSPAFMPLALLGIWHVVAAPGSGSVRPRRLIEALSALAFLGVFSGGRGVVGAYWLLSAAALVPWLFPLLERGGPGRWAPGLLWLPLIWGAFLVITGGLAAQVTYTVLAAAGIAAAIWVYHRQE